jgi:predicted GNAT family N-acyltransferase
VIEIGTVAGDDELAAALDLRERVFCEEQGVPLEADRDGLDEEAIQLVARDDGGVIGTCRVLIEGELGRFGRLCVAAQARRRGIAAALLAAAEEAARDAGATRMRLHAQTGALSLYTHAGYAPDGAPFDEEGIEHLAMEKRLA